MIKSLALKELGNYVEISFARLCNKIVALPAEDEETDTLYLNPKQVITLNNICNDKRNELEMVLNYSRLIIVNDDKTESVREGNVFSMMCQN